MMMVDRRHESSASTVRGQARPSYRPAQYLRLRDLLCSIGNTSLAAVFWHVSVSCYRIGQCQCCALIQSALTHAEIQPYCALLSLRLSTVRPGVVHELR